MASFFIMMLEYPIFALGVGESPILMQHVALSQYIVLCPRPITEGGERVAPSDLSEYRLAHNFLGPSCLCAADTGDRTAYVEAAIFVPLTGEFTGEYIATCASDSCGYWSEFFPSNGLKRKVDALISLYGTYVYEEWIVCKKISFPRWVA